MNRLILGLLRGDEGKGKITDYFAKQANIVIRYAGSCNAGHTIYRGNEKIVLHPLEKQPLRQPQIMQHNRFSQYARIAVCPNSLYPLRQK